MGNRISCTGQSTLTARYFGLSTRISSKPNAHMLAESSQACGLLCGQDWLLYHQNLDIIEQA
jgi:hypothetical protein